MATPISLSLICRCGGAGGGWESIFENDQSDKVLNKALSDEKRDIRATAYFSLLEICFGGLKGHGSGTGFFLDISDIWFIFFSFPMIWVLNPSKWGCKGLHSSTSTFFYV